MSLYLVVELLVGQEPYKYIRLYGHFEEENTMELFRQIRAALRCSDGHSIVHHDLKPDIILDKNGKLKIMDFVLSTLDEPGQRLKHHWCLPIWCT